MKNLDKYYGIDGIDGSGKDYFIQNMFYGYKVIKAGGAGLNEEKIFEFSENVLKNQYKQVFSNLNQNLVLNRTFISFLVGKIIDKEYLYNELWKNYEVLKTFYNIKGLVNIIIQRNIEQIKEVLKIRKKQNGGLSNYEQRLLESNNLLLEQQELYNEIGNKIGAIFINNDGTENLFLTFLNYDKISKSGN